MPSIWDTVSKTGKKIADYNHWPNVVNWVIDYKVLLCNQDNWIAQFTFAGAMFGEMFWTNFVPSPREIERKTVTGGYRCGFYAGIKFKSPIEIVFGKGTSTVVGEIASPFAKGLFYWWAQQVAYDAFKAWETLMFPQLICAPYVGDACIRNSRATAPPGTTSGVPGLGEVIYDPYGWLSPTQPSADLPPGRARAYTTWIANAGPTGISSFKTGFQVEGVVVEVEEHGGALPGEQIPVIREYQNTFESEQQIAAWYEITSGPSVVGSAVTNVFFIIDHLDSPDADAFPSLMPPNYQHWIDPDANMDGRKPFNP